MAFQQRIRSAALQAAAAVALVEVTTHLPSEGRSSLAYHHLFDRVLTPLGRRLLDPEDAHHLAVAVVRHGLAPRLSREGARAGRDRVDMAVSLGAGARTLRLPGPIGLAAGFDKDGTAVAGLFEMGFAFVEVGSVTPRPQPGNARPRSFRLPEDRGVINRFGFNSEGVERVGEHLREYVASTAGGDDEPMNAVLRDEKGQVAVVDTVLNSLRWTLGWAWQRLLAPERRTGVLGVNLGKNKTSEDEVGDYTAGIRELGRYAGYLVINISSPNTPGLRALQQREPLRRLLAATLAARDAHAPHAPLFVKIAPDLSPDELADVAEVVLETGVDGLVVSNTTNARPATLASPRRDEVGGLSGAPLRERSTECVRAAYRLTGGAVPIIGVGGVGSGRDAYEKLRAGASAVQVYSMLVYEGPGLASRIRKELADLLAENGYRSVEDVVGADHEDIYWRRREERVRRLMREKGKTEQEIVEL